MLRVSTIWRANMTETDQTNHSNLNEQQQSLKLGPASTLEEHWLRKILLGETMVRDAPYTENSFQTR